MSVYFSQEVSSNDIEFGAKVFFNGGRDWSRNVFYYNDVLTLQISSVKNLFGVVSYVNPQPYARGISKYSTGFCLKPNNPYVASFVQLLGGLESNVRARFANCGTFVSTVKVNARGEKHLRVKLPVRNNRLQFGVFYNGQKISATLEEFQSELYHGREVNVMLSLRSVWCSGGKYGLSWKLDSIEFTTRNFRLDVPSPPPNMIDHDHSKDAQEAPPPNNNNNQNKVALPQGAVIKGSSNRFARPSPSPKEKG